MELKYRYAAVPRHCSMSCSSFSSLHFAILSAFWIRHFVYYVESKCFCYFAIALSFLTGQFFLLVESCEGFLENFSGRWSRICTGQTTLRRSNQWHHRRKIMCYVSLHLDMSFVCCKCEISVADTEIQMTSEITVICHDKPKEKSCVNVMWQNNCVVMSSGNVCKRSSAYTHKLDIDPSSLWNCSCL